MLWKYILLTAIPAIAMMTDVASLMLYNLPFTKSNRKNTLTVIILFSVVSLVMYLIGYAVIFLFDITLSPIFSEIFVFVCLAVIGIRLILAFFFREKKPVIQSEEGFTFFTLLVQGGYVSCEAPVFGAAQAHIETFSSGVFVSMALMFVLPLITCLFVLIMKNRISQVFLRRSGFVSGIMTVLSASSVFFNF